MPKTNPKSTKEMADKASLTTQLHHAATKNKRMGWRRSELGFSNTKRDDKVMLAAMAADFCNLSAYLSAMAQCRKMAAAAIPNLLADGVSQCYLAYAWRSNKDGPCQAFLSGATNKNCLHLYVG